MNKRIWIPIVSAMLMLGACSDDETPGGGNGRPQWNSEGQGYVTLALKLPTTSGNSRANDSFDDGLPSEYAVNNATLLIFTKPNENAERLATFHSAYKLNVNNWNPEADNSNQVTTNTRITQLINNYDSETLTAYAIVVLNHNNLLTVNDDHTASLNGEELTTTSTWYDVQHVLLEGKNLCGDGILMLNAPLLGMAGGETTTAPSGAPTALAEIDGNRVYSSQAEAATAAAAATVYVERAVAKVSVSSTASGKFEEKTEGKSAEITYEVDGWLLDITNKKSYFGHVGDDHEYWLGYTSAGLETPNYRFVGDVPVETAVSKYRIHWVEDPNYIEYKQDDFNKIAEGSISSATFKSMSGYDYCLENTSDVANMNENQSTRVIVRAKFHDGKDFYTIDQNASELFDRDGMIAQFKQRLLGNEAFTSWVKEKVTGGSVTEDNVELTFDAEAEKKGKMVVESIKLTSVTATEEVPEAYITYVNGINMNKYTNGYAYYPVVIKHFGDALTPWNKWENPRPSADNIYPGGTTIAEKNYLGRYGVVRNNWYDLTVTSISHLGYPDVPPAEGTDDSMDAYISVEINILSWAKRTQNVEL